MSRFEGFIKILDFGVARASFSSKVQGRRLRGKPRYMAPEQTRGRTPTPATDTFALGIVAWELLTGLRLFEGDDIKTVLEAVRRAEAPPVAKFNPDVPAAVSDVVARALAPEPEERCNVAELTSVLARAARDLSEDTGSRSLATWIASIFPRPAAEYEETTATTQVHYAELEELGGFEDEATDIDAWPGVRTEANAPPPGALLERRRVVVTFVRLEGGDPSSRRELGRGLTTLAFKRDAVVQGNSANELLAIFGLEIAGDDDVAAAMQYALDAVELAREASSPMTSTPLAVRIASRAGILARKRGESYDLAGDDVDEARQLVAEAEPGRPLLTGPPGRLASVHFSFRELPAKRIATGRLRILELLGPTNYDERARALSGRRGRFVGREAELSQLAALVESSVTENKLSSGAIVGNAGVGKSRLIAELSARLSARAHAAHQIVVAASAESRDSPFSLIGDLLQAALNLPPRRGEQARGQLVSHFRQTLVRRGLPRTEIDEMVDVVEAALELRDGARVSEPRASAHLRDRLTAMLRRIRSHFPADRPRLVVLEDLHNADGASIAVLAGLLTPPIRAGADTLITTARRGDTTHDALTEHLGTVIELRELGDAEARILIEDRLGPAADTQTVAAVASRAAGNPLFIEELAAAVKQSKTQQVPATAREVVTAQVDRLSPGAKVVLQHAAVIGQSVRVRILEELLATDLHVALRELTEEGLLVQVGGVSATDSEGQYQFRHGLISEVVYESLTEESRHRTHARLGHLLALRYEAGRDEPPSVIARHLAAGGDGRAAASYWCSAGGQALSAFFAEAAVDFFSRALELDHAEEPIDREERWQATLGRARALAELGRHDDLGRDVARLRSLIGASAARESEVAMLDARHHLRLGDYTAAADATHTAERAAARAGDELARGHALRIRAEAFERTGAYERAVAAVSEALLLFRDMGAAWEANQAQVGLGRIHLMRCRYREADEAYGPVLEELETWSDPWLERLARNHVAVIHHCMGHFETAMQSATASFEICERIGDRARAGDNESVRGIILSEVGLFAQAAEHFERALTIAADTDSRWSHADCLVYAGTNDLRMGDRTRGQERLAEALKLARTIGARYVEANCLVAAAAGHLKGASIADLGRAFDAAVTAVEIATESQLIGARIQALSRLAEATARTGDARQAVERSSEAVTLLEEQEFIEGAEEEIWLVHARLSEAVGQKAEAEHAHLKAKACVEAKLRGFTKAEWRRAFRELPSSVEALSDR